MLTLPMTLTHAEAAELVRGLRQAVRSEPSEVVVDASALQAFDSSALAVMLESRREARVAGKGFSVKDLPPPLRQLAGLYGVEALLPAAA
ncbi:MAG: STAS domain-containing protein [Burkholderiaceae bacterium]|nr:STAS domain-containing protein [Burkholderiaceae bacterium]